MSYATVADVDRLDGAVRYQANTPVTASDVGEFARDAAAELDSILSAGGYSLPIATGATVSLALLRRYTALGAHAMAQAAWPDSPLAESAEKAWCAAKEMLRSGKAELPDAEKNAAELRVRTTFGAESAATAYFRRDMEF